MLDLDQHIWQLLDLDLLDGALFSAEQLYTFKPSDESKYLHGLVLYRLRRYESAAKVLHGEKYLPSVYLYSQCALKLNKCGEGISALNSARPWVPVPGQRGSPSLAALNLLLGRLREKEGDKNNAAILLAQSAKQDPLLVENVTRLISIPGMKLEINPLFTEQKEEHVAALGLSNMMRSPVAVPRTPLLINRRSSHANTHGTPLRVPSSGQHHLQQQMDTPIHFPPPRGYRNITPTPLKTPEQPPLPMAPRRNKIHRAIRDGGDDTFLCPNTLFDSDASLMHLERPRGTEGDVTFESIFKIYYTALQFMSKYEMRQALAEIERLPGQHQNTPTMLAIAGKCYYELLDYKKAADAYGQLHTADPFRTQDMECYSTVLWHLKDSAKLAYLAHEMVSVDREAWQSWCAVGNSFSLQNDVTNAIECFTRAVQLNSSCAFAYTLQGHEYLINEELQTATNLFRCAIDADPLCYSAYFGIAMVYYRSEQLDGAESFCTQAIRINPNNPALLALMGVLYEAKGEEATALKLYKRARSLDPDSLAARYHIALSLMKNENYEQALVELKMLRDSEPNDAEVHYTLGKLYRLMENNSLAIKHLTTAMSIDPRLATSVKNQLHYINTA